MGSRRLDGTFVGRQAELASLGDEFAAVRAGSPRIVLVTGEPGIGKTALARRFLQGLNGVRTLEASGEEAETLLRFGVAEQLSRAAAGTLPAVLAGLRTPNPEAPDPVWVGAGLLELLGTQQSSGPVLILIDDCQWADRSSLEALLFALRRLQADRVLTMVLSRTGAPHGRLAGLHRLIEHGRGSWLRLGGLDAGSLRALGASLGVARLSSRAAERVRALTGGNPLHAGSLFMELTPDVFCEPSDLPLPAPRDFGALIAGRLEACPAEAQRLIQAAAVLGTSCRLSVAASVAELGEPLKPLEQAIAAHLLEERGVPAMRTVTFPHPLVQAAVYRTIGPARRADLHARAARRVEEESAALRHRMAAASGPDPELASDLAYFGMRSANRGAWDAAADALLSASRLTPDGFTRSERLLRAAKNLLMGGAVADAFSLIEEIRGAHPMPQRGLVLGSLALMSGRYDEAERLLTPAYEACPGGDEDPAPEIAALLAHVHMGRGHGAEAALWASRSMGAGRGLSPAIDALSLLAIGLVFAGRDQEGLAVVATLPEAPQMDEQTALDGYLGRGFARCVTGDTAGARLDLVAVAGHLRSRGPAHQAIVAYTTLSTAEYRLGDWDHAVAHGQLAASLAEDSDQHWLLAAAHGAACAPLAARGDWGPAEAHAGAAQRAATVVRAEFGSLAQAALAEALLARARGQPAGVVAALDPILPLADLDGIREPGILDWQVIYAAALVDLNRLRDAETVLARFERLARERDRRASLAEAARVRGSLDAALGRIDDAEVAFISGIALLDQMEMPFERALTELEYGRVLRRAGHRRAAVWHLQSAHERLLELRASPFVERCEQELALCGVTALAAGGVPRGALTPQELSVGRLVAAGRSNRQVAQELVISVKTVEYHLANVFGKLGIRSRHELVPLFEEGRPPRTRPQVGALAHN
jgi:DNA-binding CsgD family transcriptional regulator